MNPREAYKQFVIEELDRSLGYYKQACEELRQEVRRLQDRLNKEVQISFGFECKVDELTNQNQRYREALEEIYKLGVCGTDIETGEIVMSKEAKIAKKALEGEQ